MPAIKHPAALDKWAQRIYACSHAAAVDLNDGKPLPDPRSFAALYRSQRQSAKQRGIDWRITFAEWIAVWMASGQWARRGRHRGCFVMSRFNDVGPYAVLNVEIKGAGPNCAEARLHDRRRLAVHVPIVSSCLIDVDPTRSDIVGEVRHAS